MAATCADLAVTVSRIKLDYQSGSTPPTALFDRINEVKVRILLFSADMKKAALLSIGSLPGDISNPVTPQDVQILLISRCFSLCRR